MPKNCQYNDMIKYRQSTIRAILLPNGSWCIEAHGPQLADNDDETFMEFITSSAGEPMTRAGAESRAREEARKRGFHEIVINGDDET